MNTQNKQFFLKTPFQYATSAFLQLIKNQYYLLQKNFFSKKVNYIRNNLKILKKI